MANVLTTGAWLSAPIKKPSFFARLLRAHIRSSERRAGRLVGFALWQSTPLAAGRPRDEQRVLKLVASDAAAFERLIDGLQADAIASRLRRIAVRCQTAMSAAYTHLTGRGFRVHWTDLRMTLPDAPEPEVDGVLMSNWEI